MIELMRSLWREDAGQDLGEYVLLVSLIAIAVVVALVAFGDSIQLGYEGAKTTLSGAVGS